MRITPSVNANEELIPTEEPVFREKHYGTVWILGEPHNLTVEFQFFPEGALYVLWNDVTFTLIPMLAATAPITLYQNRSHVAFRRTGLNYDVWLYFDFERDPDRVKITIRGTVTQATELRLRFLSNRFGYYNATARIYHAGTRVSDRICGIGFSWFDTAHDFLFDAETATLRFPVSTTFEIDPSIVVTDASDLNQLYPNQRKSFFANGRFWEFYANDGIRYKTSENGVSWSSESSALTTLSTDIGELFSVWYNGSGYFSYVAVRYNPRTSREYITYRSGTPNSDGSITWRAAEQTVYTASSSSDEIRLPSVCLDWNGYPLIGYSRGSGATFNAYVTKSTKNDGTWTTVSGYPVTLSSSSSTNHLGVTVLPLHISSARCVAIYVKQGGYIQARRYSGSGSTWGTERSTTQKCRFPYSYSAIAFDSNVVRVVWINNSLMVPPTYNVYYTTFSYTSDGFGAFTANLGTCDGGTSPILIRDTYYSHLYVLKAQSSDNTISYQRHNGSAWEGWVTWLTESDVLVSGTQIIAHSRSDYREVNIGVTWVASPPSPYDYKFQILTFREWIDTESWSGQFLPFLAWNVVELWSGVFLPPLVWNVVELWSGIAVAPIWSLVESWSGVFAVRFWRLVELWSGEFLARIWHYAESWSGTLRTRIWSLAEIWSGVFTAKSWSLAESWSGVFLPFKSWSLVETWSGIIFTPFWNVVELWSGTFRSGIADLGYLIIPILAVALFVGFAFVIAYYREER